MEEGARWERGYLEEPAGVLTDRTRGATAGAQALGIGAGSAGQGEGGGAGSAADGSPALSDRAGPRGARRRARGAEGVCGRGSRGRGGSPGPAEGRGALCTPRLVELGQGRWEPAEP